MPEISASYVDVYPFRRVGDAFEFLLLKRQPEAYLGGTWHAVHGKIEAGETAVAAGLRELREETGLRPVRFWQLDSPHVFFMARMDEIIVAPCFAAEIDGGAQVQLNHEHTDFRWVGAQDAARTLMWPGQRKALVEIVEYILSPNAAAEPWLRVPLPPAHPANPASDF